MWWGILILPRVESLKTQVVIWIVCQRGRSFVGQLQELEVLVFDQILRNCMFASANAFLIGISGGDKAVVSKVLLTST